MTMMHSPEAQSGFDREQVVEELNGRGWAELADGQSVARLDIYDAEAPLVQEAQATMAPHRPGAVEVYGVVDSARLEQKLQNRDAYPLAGSYATILAMHNNGLVANAEVFDHYVESSEQDLLRSIAFAVGRRRNVGVDFGVKMRKSINRW